jgi:hypothetical protein
MYLINPMALAISAKFIPSIQLNQAELERNADAEFDLMADEERPS